MWTSPSPLELFDRDISTTRPSTILFEAMFQHIVTLQEERYSTQDLYSSDLSIYGNNQGIMGLIDQQSFIVAMSNSTSVPVEITVRLSWNVREVVRESRRAATSASTPSSPTLLLLRSSESIERHRHASASATVP